MSSFIIYKKYSYDRNMLCRLQTFILNVIVQMISNMFVFNRSPPLNHDDNGKNESIIFMKSVAWHN